MAELRACRAPFQLSAVGLERVRIDHTVYCERYEHDVKDVPHEAYVRMPKYGADGPPRWFWAKWNAPKVDVQFSDVGAAPAQNARPPSSETPYIIPENDLVDPPHLP